MSVNVKDDEPTALVPETGIEPVRPLFTKRRILSPLCLPISPLGPSKQVLEARPGVEPG